MNPAIHFARLFRHPEGADVLAYLKRITQERILSPTVGEGELRYLEGQRALVALILSLIHQGQQKEK